MEVLFICFENCCLHIICAGNLAISETNLPTVSGMGAGSYKRKPPCFFMAETNSF